VIDSVGGIRAYQQQFPSIACDAAGRCHAVWCSQAGGTHWQLAYAQRDTNGEWSSPMILTGLDSGGVSYPSIICDADSGIHVVWYDDSSGNQDVYYLHGVTPGSGVEEGRKTPDATRFTQNPSIVRNRLDILQSAFCNLKSAIVLRDASGRRVMSLHPGRNDIRGLPTGLYFIIRESATVPVRPSTIVIVR
jgi:hypothetical protein